MTANLNNAGQKIITGNDSIVIVDNFQSKRGGTTLDVTGFTPEVIQEGHLLIKETSTGNYKPMPVNGGVTAYAALPAGHTYAGINIATIPTKKPFAGVLLRGTINVVAAPMGLASASILPDVKTALPHIIFTQD